MKTTENLHHIVKTFSRAQTYAHMKVSATWFATRASRFPKKRKWVIDYRYSHFATLNNHSMYSFLTQQGKGVIVRILYEQYLSLTIESYDKSITDHGTNFLF